MKTKFIFAICMLFAAIAFSQNETFISSKNPAEIKVTPPVFTGVLFNADSEDDAVSPISKYLNENVEYPVEAFDHYIQGTEVVQITIDTKGNITDYKIINSVCPEIDNEMISALKRTSGMWQPGYNNDKPVEMTKEVSMHFCLDNLTNTTAGEIFKERAKTCYSKGSYALFEKENVRKALKHYDRGINYLPYDKSLLMLRGVCRYELGDKEGAIEDWERMSSLGGIDMTDVIAKIENMKGYNELIAIVNKPK